MGVAGMVLGILAVVFFWVPVFNWMLIAVGLPLSIAGLVVGKQRGEPVGMAIAGIVLNCIPLVISIIIIILIGSFLGLLAGLLGGLAGGF
jgi:hypothetical protein